MLRKVVFLYEDSERPNQKIKEITGNKTFGETILKRKNLKMRVLEEVEGESFVAAAYSYASQEEQKEVWQQLKNFPKEYAVIHMRSSFGIRNREAFKVLLEKAQFVQQTMRVEENEKTALFLSKNIPDYLEYAMEYNKEGIVDMAGLQNADAIQSSCLVDLGEPNNFLQFITSGFDARFFNALESDDFTVTKSSTNKKKIKSEYEYYYLLPETMKMWFVMPFDYKEEAETASYTMERVHTTDIAIRFVHEAVGLEEFEDILKRLFFFIKSRNTKEVTKEQYEKEADKLYVGKVLERMKQLKENAYYQVFDNNIKNGTKYQSIDEIVEKYKELYEKVKLRDQSKGFLAVGHGDLCFSNILYHKETSLIKLIDPKGALSEEELYMHPYYDLAKLSHSICGRYDFFNNGLYEIKVVGDMKLELEVDFDNSEYVKIFKRFLAENGFDYVTVRLYEASLFLSMLPLHMDNVQKTFGFLLNGMNILDEVEECLKD
ncbi:MAG: hypothetical protein IJF03_06985 [Lachnospiraceae bacterium]|nr:hypothetical protein [Lachnospiraceae bacterium]